MKNLLNVHPLLTDKNRLAIVAVIAGSEDPTEFKSLLTSLELTKGNLSSHIKKLESEGIVNVVKDFVGSIPRTRYTCTARGKEELRNYLLSVEKMLKHIV